MKNLRPIFLAVYILSWVNFTFAQSKMAFKKVVKDTSIEIKKFEAEGWINFKGDESLGKQLQKTWFKEQELNEFGFPRWIHTNTSASASDFNKSKTNAINNGKIHIFNICSSNIKSLLDENFKKGALDTTNLICLNKLLELSIENATKNGDKFIISLQQVRDTKEKNLIEIYIKLMAENIYLHEFLLKEMKSRYVPISPEEEEKLKPYFSINTYMKN